MGRGNRARWLALTGLTLALGLAPAAHAAPEPYEGYVFAYFTGEGTADGEQIYFAASRGNDPLRWDELNAGRPVLTSTLGDKGVRDPFIIRSHEGDRFFLIATDLKIYGNGDWDAAQRRGSKYIEVWESTDLVHWSEQRHVRVAPDTAGNTWAPEAYYDEALGQYVVFWASKIYAADDPGHTGNTYQKMIYATTRDFRTFSEAKVWYDPGYAVIDSTVIKHGDTFHRLTKDERNNGASAPCGKFLMQHKATSLLDPEWDFVRDCIGKAGPDGPGVARGEGPTVFKSNTEDRWYLLIDEFGGRGYVPFETTDLDSGRWRLSTSSELPARPRHGTVIPVTRAELERLRAEPPKLAAREDGLVASYTTAGMGSTLADTSGNGHDAVLRGDVAREDGALRFGGTDGHVELPDDVMAGLDEITVATEVWIDPAQPTPYWIWGLGNTNGANGNGYLFTTGNGYRTSISRGNWSREQTAGTGNLPRGAWHRLAYTLADGKAVLYLDGVEVARNDAVTIKPREIGLGRTLANSIGRSLYGADRYFKGRMRHFAIYDRALSADEVGLFVPREVPGEVGGTVPATLSLSLGAAADFGAFVPGSAREYLASTTATVVSTAGDATLTAAGSGTLANGAFALARPVEIRGGEGPFAPVGERPLATFDGPVSGATVALGFRQAIGAGEALRTGRYATTLTLTLSTTRP